MTRRAGCRSAAAVLARVALITWVSLPGVMNAGVVNIARDALERLPDPTRPPGASGAERAANPGLHAILRSEGRNFALIGERRVTVGDRVGDAVVKEIRPYEVVLNRAGRSQVLRLVPAFPVTVPVK